MEPYYFPIALGLIWIAFATIQDLRTREIANWLTFSLLTFAFAYRAFFALMSQEISFLLWGIVGGAAFIALAYAFYYGHIFAGGDAKLLMGVGVLLPYKNSLELILWGTGFILVLFFIGAIYSLIYSVGLVYQRRRVFMRDFQLELQSARFLFALSLFLSFLLIVLQVSPTYWFFSSLFLLFVPFLYAYLQAVDSRCMTLRVASYQLCEGDWLARNVRVGGQTIITSVHGLSRAEIQILRKYKKSVWIKQGIPFVPVFLITWGIMVYAVVIAQVDLKMLLLLF